MIHNILCLLAVLRLRGVGIAGTETGLGRVSLAKSNKYRRIAPMNPILEGTQTDAPLDPSVPGAQLPPTEGRKFMDMIRSGLPDNQKLKRSDIPGCEMGDD